MKRDFSNASKQKILKLINQADSDKMPGVSDWMGGNWGAASKWMGKLGLNSYFQNVESYKRKLGNKNKTAQKAVNTIFQNAAAADATCQKKLMQQTARLKELDRQIQRLNEEIRPMGTVDAGQTLISLFAGFAKKLGKHTNQSKVSLSGTFGSYFGKLFGLAEVGEKDTKGAISYFLSLFGESVSVEKGLFNYFEKELHPYEAAKLDGKVGKTMGFLSIMGDAADVVREGIDTYDVFSNSDSSGYDKSAQIVEMLNSIFGGGTDLYATAQSTKKTLQFVDQTGKNQILSGGQTLKYQLPKAVQTKVGKVLAWGAVVDVATSTISDTIHRLGETMEDGELSSSDLDSVAIHGATGGINAVSSFFTLGLLEWDAYGLEETTKSYVKSDRWTAKYVRDQSNPAIFRAGISMLSAVDVFMIETVKTVGKGLDKVGKAVAAGGNAIGSWVETEWNAIKKGHRNLYGIDDDRKNYIFINGRRIAYPEYNINEKGELYINGKRITGTELEPTKKMLRNMK